MFLRCNILLRSAAAGLLAIGFGGVAVAAEPAYLREVSDIPLPAGLVEDAAAGVAFDKPGGRIVEAVARGDGAAGPVVAFYRAALPQLGWRPVGAADALSWRREGESLRLEVAEAGPVVTVRFYLAPE
jgi:hypothetical protein